MNIERDQFLTEAIGECWHEWKQMYPAGGSECIHCKKYWPLFPDKLVQETIQRATTPNYSSWAGFGKLWEWAQKQKWWFDFVYKERDKQRDRCNGLARTLEHTVHPDRFADAVYAYLKEAANHTDEA